MAVYSAAPEARKFVEIREEQGYDDGACRYPHFFCSPKDADKNWNDQQNSDESLSEVIHVFA